MRFKEFNSSIKKFKVVLRTKQHNAIMSTIFFSDSAINLRRMLVELFGKNNVLSLSEIVSEAYKSHQPQYFCVSETETKARVLSPQELQVKALADKAEDYKQQEKALKARQQMAKAQQNLMKAQRKPNAS